MVTLSRGTLNSNIRRNGFTLIELVMVIAIISLIVGLAIPKISALSGNNLKTVSRRLIGTIKFLYNESTMTKKIYRLNYDLSNKEYWVTVLQDNGEFVNDNVILKKKIILPNNIRFKDVDTQINGKITEGEAWTGFYPVGRAEKTTIHLIEDEKINYTLTINPLSGSVKVYNDYLDVN